MNFKEFFKGSKTAVDFQAAIGETESQLATIRGELAELQARRGGVLLDGTDKALDALEAEAVAKDRDAERLTLALDELRRRRDDAEERERQAALDKCHTQGEAVRARSAALIDNYEQHARSMAAILDEIVAAQEMVRAINSELAAERNPRLVEPVGFVEMGNGMTTDLPRRVQLPAITGSSARIWPPMNAEGGIVCTAAARERLRSAVELPDPAA